MIPSTRLYWQASPVTRWEGQTLRIEPSTFCGSASKVTYAGYGWEHTKATVGTSAVFTIQSTDQYGNFRDGPDQLVTVPDDFFTGRLEYSPGLNVGASDYELLKYQTPGGISAVVGVTGRFTFSIDASEHTRAGNRALYVDHAMQGGLSATYYSGANFTEAPINPYVWPADGVPAQTTVDATVDFSQGANTASTVVQTWPAAPMCIVNALYPLQV